MTQPRLSDRKFGLIFAAIFAIFTLVGWFGFEIVLRWAMICSGTFLTLVGSISDPRWVLVAQRTPAKDFLD